MKYFFDTEFLEGSQSIRFPYVGAIIGNTKPTIDLISIGIVSEDNREYYAVSRDFNLKEAWDRFQVTSEFPNAENSDGWEVKEYWIRDNVLRPIFNELAMKRAEEENKSHRLGIYTVFEALSFNYKNLKTLINKYGKTNKQIAEEIEIFCLVSENSRLQYQNGFTKNELVEQTQPNPGFTLEFSMNNRYPEFYAYYADYDWVVFCWLFGKMIDLPKGFPMYCKDLKQDFDLFNANFKLRKEKNAVGNLDKSINSLKDFRDYPKETNEHHALADARWGYELYKFLQKL